MTDIELQKPDPMEQVVRAIMSTIDAQKLTQKTKVLTRVDLVKYVCGHLREAASKKYDSLRCRYQEFRSRNTGEEYRDKALKKVEKMLKVINEARGEKEQLEGHYMGFYGAWFEDMIKKTDRKLEPFCKVRVRLSKGHHCGYGGEDRLNFTFRMPMAVKKQQALRDEYGREFLLLSRYNDLAHGHAIDREKAARLVLKCTPEGAAINEMIDTMSTRLDEALATLPGEKLKELQS